MELHKSFLDRICRGCSNIIKGNSYRALIYSKEIHDLFDVDLTTEDPEIYPENICYSCWRMLRYKQVDETYSASGSLPEFPPHHNSCRCIKPMPKRWGRPWSMIKSQSKRSLFKIEATKQGFVVLFSSDVEDVYVKPEKGRYSTEKVLIVHIDSWKVLFRNELLHLPWCPLPRDLSSSPSDILAAFQSAVPCMGNEDCGDLVAERMDIDGAIRNKDGVVIGEIETFNRQKVEHLCTFRSKDCETLTAHETYRCAPCRNFREVLLQRRRNKKKRSSADMQKNTRNDYLSKSELQKKAQELAKEKAELKRDNDRLQERNEKLDEMWRKTVLLPSLSQEGLPEAEDPCPLLQEGVFLL